MVLALELPSKVELDPTTDLRLASFSLIVSDAEGDVQQINTVPYVLGSREVDIGELPVGDIDHITLIAYSGTNQILGYAEGRNLSVSAYDDVLVNLPLRKPFTYIAGGPVLHVFDTTLSHTDDRASEITITDPLPAVDPPTTTAVASSPDGRFILAAVADPVVSNNSSLRVFDTGQHEEVVAYRVLLTNQPDSLSVSPDGHWAVLSSSDASETTVVDLDELLSGAPPSSTIHTIAVDGARRAAFAQTPDGRDLAFILRNPLPIVRYDPTLPVNVRCGTSGIVSHLDVVELPDGPVVHTVNHYDSAVADITSSPGDNRIFVAEPCNGEVTVVDALSYQVSFLTNSREPQSLIATQDTLWIGSLDESPDGGATPARVVITKLHLATQQPTSVLSAPFVDEGLVLTGNENESSQLVFRSNPSVVSVYRLSIPPGADRISALVYAGYLGDYAATPIVLSDGTINTVTNYSWSYVGVDASSAEIRRLYRGYCYGVVNEGTAEQQLFCCNPRDLSETAQCDGTVDHMFVPTAATTLFGVP